MSRLSDNPSTIYRVETAWGSSGFSYDGTVVTKIYVPETKECAALGRSEDAFSGRAPSYIRELAERWVAYFNGEAINIVEPKDIERWLDVLRIDGFRKDVSLALFDVPRGVTISYGELAEIAGRPKAARAVGSVCSRNPLPVVIPCHRVLHAGARNGNVGTYGAGTGRGYKFALLKLEDAPFVRA